MIDLQAYQLWTVFLVGLCVIVAASEIGLWLGWHTGGSGGGNETTMAGASLGLLALMVGFTFAMALGRFDARREAILTEANAIGTVALRARLLPAPYDKQFLHLLKDYVEIRLDITRRVPTPFEMDAAITRSNMLQEQLWRQAMLAVERDKAMVPTGLFVQALNEMIDDQGKRVAAARNRVPNVVMLSLYGIAAVAAAFGGYAKGLESRPNRLPLIVMALLVSGVILLVMDLDRPNSGFIAVSQQPMIDAAASIAGFTEQAPVSR